MSEHRLHRVCCPECAAVTAAEPPAGSRWAFGPRLQAAVVTLAVRNRVSRRDATELARELFGVEISTGTVDTIVQRAGEALAARTRGWSRRSSARRSSTSTRPAGRPAPTAPVSDAHSGLKRAIAQVLGCPWQRCSVHFLREALGHARRDQQPMLAALIRPLFSADDGEQARELVTDAIERLRKPLPKIAALLEEAEEDLLAFYRFPVDHRPKLRSTNPLEGVNREIGRRTDVVGIFPNDRSLIRPAASVVIEQNDEWLVGKCYLSNH